MTRRRLLLERGSIPHSCNRTSVTVIVIPVSHDRSVATYETKLPADGEYVVRMVINHAESRSETVPLLIVHADGESIITVNQKQRPDDGVFATIGRFRFEAGRPAQVVVKASEASPGYVICDAIQFIPADQMVKIADASAASDRQQLSDSELQTLQKELKSAEEARKAHEKQKPDMPAAMSVEEEKDPSDWHLHIRGEIRNLGPVVPRGYIQVATPIGMDARIDAASLNPLRELSAVDDNLQNGSLLQAIR